MERRTHIGGLLLSSGIIGVRWPVAARGRRDCEANEEAMWRLRNAHEFFPKADFVRPADLLYQVGIVSQLALTARLVATRSEERSGGKEWVRPCRYRGQPVP